MDGDRLGQELADTPGRSRAGRVAPFLAVLFVSSAIWAAWEFRVVAEATRYHILNSADPILYYFPMLEAAFNELRSGKLFFWNPYQMSGAPGLATGVVGFLYPPNLLHLVLPTAVAMEVLTIVHLVLAALFTAIAARSVRVGWVGAVVAGLAYALTYPLGSIYFPNGVAALAWLPLGIAAIEHAVTGGDRRWVPVLTISACMPWLASAPQSATYTWVAFGLCASFALARRYRRSRSLADIAQVGVRLVAAMVAAILLAAPQVLPMLELSTYSARGDEALPIRSYIPWGRMPLSIAFRRVVLPPAELHVYFVGAVTISLALAALWTRRVGIALFCFVLVVWGITAAAAPSWYLKVMGALPIVGSYRLPGRAAFCATFGVAMLAGLGTDVLFGDRTGRRSRAFAALVVAAMSAALAYYRYPHPSWWVPALVPLLAGAAILPYRAVRTACVPVALFLLLADLTGFTRNTAMLPYDGKSTARDDARWQMLAEVRDRAGFARVVLAGSTTDRINWSPKSSMMRQLYTVEDHEPLTLGAYADFFRYASTGGRNTKPGASTWMGELPRDLVLNLTTETRRFLNLLSVRYILVDSLALMSPSVRASFQGLSPVPLDVEPPEDVLERVLMFEDRNALPRAYVVHRAECIERFDDQLARLRDPEFEPRSSVVLDGGCGPAHQATASRARITSYGATRVAIETEAESPGWLVLTDSWYPGWQVFVNGDREPLLRANAVVRAVEVPSGKSLVEFRYVPWTFYLGVAAAGAAVVSWLGWMLLRRRAFDSRFQRGRSI